MNICIFIIRTGLVLPIGAKVRSNIQTVFLFLFCQLYLIPHYNNVQIIWIWCFKEQQKKIIRVCERSDC